MVTHLANPAPLIMWQPFFEALTEDAGIEVLRPRLPFEKGSNLYQVDAECVDQFKEIEQVTALTALRHAAELLRCDLVQWVDVERNALGKVIPDRPNTQLLDSLDELVGGNVDLELARLARSQGTDVSKHWARVVTQAEHRESSVIPSSSYDLHEGCLRIVLRPVQD